LEIKKVIMSNNNSDYLDFIDPNIFNPGDYVRCTSTKLKHCDFNSTYKVAESKNTWSIRLEGSKHFVSSLNFVAGSIKDVRAKKLKVLSGETKTEKISTVRKINRNKNLDEKKFKLFEMLLNRWLTDRRYIDSPQHLSDPYYTYEEFLKKIVKSDRIFGVEIKDFDVIKNMKVSEAFDLYIKTKQSVKK